MTQSRALNNTYCVFAAPGKLFAALREQPTVAFPLWIVALATSAVLAIYLLRVDVVMLIELQAGSSVAEAAAADELPAAIEELRSNTDAQFRSRMTLLLGYAIFSAGFYIVFKLCSAGYLHFISRATGASRLGYRHWLSLVCWIGLPALLGTAASLVNLLASDATAMLPDEVNPLAFSSLFGLANSGIGAMSLGLTSVWGLILLVMGYSAWTEKGWSVSGIIVAAPLVVIAALYIFVDAGATST